MDAKLIGKMLFQQVKEYAKDAGHGCEVLECGYVTLGMSCDICYKKLCSNHLYFQMVAKSPRMAPICPSCVVKQHPELFEVGDEYEEEYEEDDDSEDDPNEVIDAEFEET